MNNRTVCQNITSRSCFLKIFDFFVEQNFVRNKTYQASQHLVPSNHTFSSQFLNIQEKCPTLATGNRLPFPSTSCNYQVYKGE